MFQIGKDPNAVSLGGSDLDKKISLVSWATVCSDKSKRGVGIKCFSKMNKALLCKWSWRFANDRNALWRKVIYCKIGESVKGWHTRDLRGGYGTSLWKEIRKEWFSFFQNAVFALGDGRRINLWNDVWCGEESLISSFPSLFRRPRSRIFGRVERGLDVGPQLS